MAILQEDVSRFAVEAVCGGKRKEEVVVDLTDAGVSRPDAERMVDEIDRIHQVLRSVGADRLEEKVLQAWASPGDPVERAPTNPPPKGPVEPRAPGRPGARGLVWALRCLALVAACWGVWEVNATVKAARLLSTADWQTGPLTARERQVVQVVESARTRAVFTAALLAAAAVAVPLVLAEGLSLLLAIESNTRARRRPEDGSQPAA
jgi:hypothetical protein